MYYKLTLFITALLFTGAASAAGQQQEPLGERLNEQFKSEAFNLGFLLQAEGVFSFDDDDFNGGRAYDIGATRLDFRGTVDGNFTYRLQTDFRNQVSVIDAQVGYRFSDQLHLVAGSFKPFLSIDLDPSPGDTDFMNRARQVGAMMNSREIGATVLGTVGGLDYRVGMYNGTGRSRNNDNRFLYTSRLGYTFELPDGSVEIGFNGALNQTEGNTVGNTGLRSEGDRVLYGGYLKYDSSRLFGAFELLQTSFDTPDFGGNEETITGFFGTAGVRLDNKNELLARWDHLEFDLQGDSSELITIGWNHQATSLISFAVNGLARFGDDIDEQFGVSGMMQFQF